MKVKIYNLDHFGRGIAKVNDKIVFVKNAFIDEEVNIEIIKENSKYITAINKDYVNNTKCPYYMECGGCNILHISYQEQLKFKENKVKELISKYLNNDFKINDILYSKQFGYRNKITLHVDDKKIGFFKDKSNEVIDIEKCLLVDDLINNYIVKIRKYINDYPFTGEVKIKSFLNKVLISITGNVDDNIKDFIDSDVLIVNDKCLTKNSYIINEINNYKFKVSDKSFFQVNKYNVELLYNEVINYIKDKNYNKVLDLYSGTGTIGILISKYVKEVIGIEVIKDAIDDANVNKEINDIKNISFICGRVEDYIDEFNDIDSVVVDPPRSGLDKKTIENILRINPLSICYVSCDINTLIRDIKLLSDKYEVKSLTPVDMFSNTYHVETVVVLERKDK